jgi:hypothetical protein
MKNIKIVPIFVFVIIQIFSSHIIAQETKETKEITVIKENWISPYKSQDETSLCAIFSDMSYIESELHRMGRGDFHITEEDYLGNIGYADFQIDSLNTTINQDTRDNLYDNWKTTDVHNVQIIGIAKDETGNK